MKTIYLIRHAKSDWGADVDDFDRPLNDRGKRDAPVMARRLKLRNVDIDAFVSSPAKRALKTAKIFAAEFSLQHEQIVQIPELYMAPAATFYSVLESLDNSLSSVLIFSHNNGITEFANSLGIARIDNMPTCSVFAFTVEAESWVQIRTALKQFVFFDYPKNIT
jgi:phosphohistidine phosphatase